MKKMARILAMLLAFFCITSCGTTNIPVEETESAAVETTIRAGSSRGPLVSPVFVFLLLRSEPAKAHSKSY